MARNTSPPFVTVQLDPEFARMVGHLLAQVVREEKLEPDGLRAIEILRESISKAFLAWLRGG